MSRIYSGARPSASPVRRRRWRHSLGHTSRFRPRQPWYSINDVKHTERKLLASLQRNHSRCKPPFHFHHATNSLHDILAVASIVIVDLDLLFQALADPTRRRLMEELAERDGQTLYELQVRMISWHGVSFSRQGLSRHLVSLEEAGLLRTEWRWRSKLHFLQREPIQLAWKLWLGNFVRGGPQKGKKINANRADKRAGG